MEIASSFRLVFACVLGALPTSGCGKSLDEACVDMAEAECAHLATCSEALLGASYGDVAACEEKVVERCTRLPSLPGADLGPADIEACAEACRAEPCDNLALGAPPGACRFAGKSTNGSACSDGAQCQSSSCELSADGDEGECTAVRKLGDPCSLGGSPCETGLHCGDSGRCVPYGMEGDSCSLFEPCNPLYWCDAGVCAAPAEENQACAPCSGGPTCNLLEGLTCGDGGSCQPGDAASLVEQGAPACK